MSQKAPTVRLHAQYQDPETRAVMCPTETCQNAFREIGQVTGTVKSGNITWPHNIYLVFALGMGSEIDIFASFKSMLR